MAFTDRLANRGSISTGAYEIDNSCRFDNVFDSTTVADSMVRETGTPSDQTRWTLSCWVKVSEPGNTGTMNLGGANTGTPERSSIQISSGQLIWIDYPYSTFGGHNLITNRKFRDPSAWYHLVFVYNSNEGTQANRVKIYVNGIQETSFATNSVSIDSTEVSAYWNHADYEHFHGRDAYGRGWDGYLTDIYFLDGQVKAGSDFGETDEDSGIWKPKAYSGSFGNNGYHLDFESSGSMGADASGNSNDFTLTGIDATNQTTDTPTNNFCTLNPNDMTINPSYDPKIINGALEYQPEGGSSMIRGTMGMSSGKWYWEAKLATYAGQALGVCTTNMDIPITSTQEGGWIINSVGGDAHVFSLYANSAFRSYFFYDGSNSNSANSFASGTFTYGDIFGFAFDADNLDIYISKKGSWTDVKASQDPEGDPGSNTAYVYHASFNTDEDDTWLPVFSNSYNQDMILNFGNPIHSITSSNADANGYGNFEYAVPDGYYALCTKNIAEFG